MRWTNSGRLPDDFPPHLAHAARDLRSLGSYELAWPYPEILEVIEELAARHYAILGGEVLFEDAQSKQGLKFLGDNWYVNPGTHAPVEEWIRQGVETAVGYIQRYRERYRDRAWYVPTFAQAADDSTDNS